MASVTICSDSGAPQNKVWHRFHCFPIYFPWSDGTNAIIFVFWTLSFKPTFSLSSFTFIKRLFSSSSLPQSMILEESRSLVLQQNYHFLNISSYGFLVFLFHSLEVLKFYKCIMFHNLVILNDQFMRAYEHLI